MPAQTAAPTPAPALRAQDDTNCPAYRDDETPIVPRIAIAQVEFSGRLQLPISDQQAIAAEVTEHTHGDRREEVIEEALERVRFGWRNQGYFNVEVRGDPKTLTSSPVNERLSLRVEVDEGTQYRLGRITFKNNEVIRDTVALRQAFAIRDGDILSQEKIGKGLEELRRIYGKFGYLNFEPHPETKIAEQKKPIQVDVDMEEGKQFRLGVVNVLAADAALRQDFLRDFPMKPGDLYKSDLFEPFLVEHSWMFPGCPCRSWSKRTDDKSGAVTFSFDLRPCPEN